MQKYATIDSPSLLSSPLFFVFEGTDGSGTSTQAKKLAKHLEQKGLEVYSTAEPTGNFLGKNLREILQHKKNLSPKAFQLLFFADRVEHLEREIIPALAQGKIVICERYNWSSIAYGSAEGIDQEFLENISETLLEPDYTFFFDLDPKISVERIQKRGEAIEFFETKHTLEKVRKVMKNLAERCAFTKRATVFDASETPEEIFSRIDMVLTPLLFTHFFEPK